MPEGIKSGRDQESDLGILVLVKLIIGISGSLRQGSYSTKLLKAFAERVPKGYDFKILDIGSLPMFNEDLLENEPAAITKFKEEVKAAAAVLLVTPEYNRSYTPVLKNALDWGSRPAAQNVWAQKPAAVAGCSPYRLGALGAAMHLRQAQVYLDLLPLQQPEFYLSMAAEKFDANDKLTDHETEQHIADLWQAFSRHIERNT